MVISEKLACVQNALMCGSFGTHPRATRHDLACYQFYWCLDIYGTVAWWAESQSNWQKIHIYRRHSSNSTNKINLSPSCFVILSLESVDEILWYYQSNETSLSDFFHSAVYVVISIFRTISVLRFFLYYIFTYAVATKSGYMASNRSRFSKD